MIRLYEVFGAGVVQERTDYEEIKVKSVIKFLYSGFYFEWSTLLMSIDDLLFFHLSMMFLISGRGKHWFSQQLLAPTDKRKRSLVVQPSCNPVYCLVFIDYYKEFITETRETIGRQQELGPPDHNKFKHFSANVRLTKFGSYKLSRCVIWKIVFLFKI